MTHLERLPKRHDRLEALRYAIGKTLESMTREKRMQVSFLSVMAEEEHREQDQPVLRQAA